VKVYRKEMRKMRFDQSIDSSRYKRKEEILRNGESTESSPLILDNIPTTKAIHAYISFYWKSSGQSRFIV